MPTLKLFSLPPQALSTVHWNQLIKKILRVLWTQKYSFNTLITHFNVSVTGQPLVSDCKTAEGPESWPGRDKPGLGNNTAGARVRGFVATMEFRRLTPSTSGGKSKVRPPCVVIRSLRSYYVRIIKVFQLKCMVP